MARDKTRQVPLVTGPRPHNTLSTSFKSPLIQDFLQKAKKAKPEVISSCPCKKEVYENCLLMCAHGVAWLAHVENRTDLKLDYARAKETYIRV